MPVKIIPKDAILSDITNSLDQPKEYVRHVFGNMVDFHKAHGAAVVRLGTTGRGVAPHYRVQKSHGSGEILGHLDKTIEPEYFTAFHGRSHKQLEWGARELRGEHWSTRAMTYEEVQFLLGELRKFRKAK
jgi:hypothetical protein